MKTLLKSSLASTSSQAIKKRKLNDNVVQNNEISLPTKSKIPASDLLDNTKNLVSTFEARKDISYYIGKQWSAEEKIDILKNIWGPDPNYKFPQSGNRNLRFQINWTYEFCWLRYSKIQDGAFCLTCILFPPSDGLGKGGHQNPGKLVIEKYNNWKKAKDLFKKVEPIDRQINEALKKEINDNRDRLRPIIKTILFCGNQGISLRGHRDSGIIDLNEHASTENQGNFRELIKFRIDSGDNVLKNYLETANKNATYLSPLIQNEIISVCNKLILEHLVANVNKSKSFTILADETTDVSNKEQITLCVRYVDLDANKIREDFLQFIEIQNMSGKGLSDVILKSMTDFGLNTKYLTGQGYDGAAAMSGRYNGVQKFIRDEHPSAFYLHCSAHCLNLAITFSYKVPEIRNCMGTTQSVSTFFGYPKRQSILQLSIVEIFPQTNRFKLKNLCATRWVDRHDAVILFEELQPAILHALDRITLWPDSDTSSSASHLLTGLTAIRQLKFQTALAILVKILSISFPLSRYLQTVNLDLKTALEAAYNIQNNIQEIRENCDVQFQQLFLSVITLCEKFDITVSLPRQCKSDNPEYFLRVSLFIPFIDNFLDQLNDRFISHRIVLNNFDCILPKIEMKISEEIKGKFKQLVETYQDIVDECIDSNLNDNLLNGELDLWYTKYSTLTSTELKNKNVIEVYFQTCPNVYPIISKLLQIFITLPVSTATGERSFSTLRRLKTYLRNSSGQIRLNGLALLNIHRDINVDINDVLDELAKKSKRKLNINENILEVDHNYKTIVNHIPEIVDIAGDPLDPINRMPENRYERYDRIKKGPFQPVITFPRRQIGVSNRSFHALWYKDFNWLEYSSALDAAFCFACHYFSMDITSHRDHSDPAFISTGFRGWNIATKKFKLHQMSSIHISSVQTLSSYLKEIPIDVQLEKN
ncbi:52 kDa repressor of the inhibitor of the protein kinase-like [Aphis gossypii]|uniref:52 kDa repressor of the inhibitor of the protein kinase-like n=1 Tax=Aphis gossypii TaxID=80765 RepID=UPI002159526B|nr:52 kDa repressor of the inhibitor of the protein kinase-like [Aphis gossypii]